MSVLRNRVGARTHAELRDAENDLVEARVIELREDPNLLGDRTDLAYLRAIHRQLFQDIYVWAGDLRTVGIEKEDESFCAPGGISRPMEHVAARSTSSTGSERSAKVISLARSHTGTTT